MAIEKKVEFEIEHSFDPVRCRHYFNGVLTVLHCHHYMSLFHQLADDAVDYEGERLLREAAEDTFFEVLDKYYHDHQVTDLRDKIALAQEYWQVVGMGLIQFTAVGRYAVTAQMEYSHVDDGWLKKWGGRDKPVNFVTAGFVSAAAALFSNKPPRSFKTRELKSLVCGDEISLLKAVLA